jgi:hypothetical protein
LWHGTLRGSARLTSHSTFGARERIPEEKGGADGRKEQYSRAMSDIAQKLKSTPGSQSLPCHGRGCAPTIPQLAGGGNLLFAASSRSVDGGDTGFDRCRHPEANLFCDANGPLEMSG